jgi:hypothetical protein
MTSAISNDTLEGLPALGTQIGGFLQNMAPGIGIFILIVAVFGGVGAVVYAVVSVIKSKIHK